MRPSAAESAVEGCKVGRGPDIEPSTSKVFAARAAASNRILQDWQQGMAPHGATGEEFGAENADSAIGEAGHSFRIHSDPPFRPKSPSGVVGRIVHEDQVRQVLRTGQQAPEGIVAPDVCACHDEGSLAEEWQGIDDAASYVECSVGLRRIRNGGTEPGTVAERFHELPPQPGMVHDQFAYPFLRPGAQCNAL